MAQLALVDVPLDCSATGRGEERAPAALRAADLLERLDARDAGALPVRIRDSRRDPVTGIIAGGEIREASMAITGRVCELLDDGEVPLLLGGDCTLLLGAFAALPSDPGLWFVDGHADFFDGGSSPTGEAADMDLAILTGHGPDLLGRTEPAVDPSAVVLVGHRPGSADPDVARENARLDPAIDAFTAPELREHGISAIAERAAQRLSDHPTWLHLDLDVLDEAVLSAVTYPQPLGLGWEELVALTRPLASATNLVGASVADFNPDRDPTGAAAREVVEALVRIFV